MTRYERLVLSADDGVYDVPGDIVEVLDAPRTGRKKITALVELDSTATTTATPTDDSGDAQGVTAPTFYCTGTKANDDPCSREVDEEDGRCFQHPPDEE